MISYAAPAIVREDGIEFTMFYGLYPNWVVIGMVSTIITAVLLYVLWVSPGIPLVVWFVGECFCWVWRALKALWGWVYENIIPAIHWYISVGIFVCTLVLFINYRPELSLAERASLCSEWFTMGVVLLFSNFCTLVYYTKVHVDHNRQHGWFRRKNDKELDSIVSDQLKGLAKVDFSLSIFGLIVSALCQWWPKCTGTVPGLSMSIIAFLWAFFVIAWDPVRTRFNQWRSERRAAARID